MRAKCWRFFFFLKWASGDDQREAKSRINVEEEICNRGLSIDDMFTVFTAAKHSSLRCKKP